MSTPIETNTEELRQAVKRVYNLPKIGGSGNAQPDLVIGLSCPNLATSLTSENTSVVVESGSLEAVVEALRAGRHPIVKCHRFYIFNGFDTSFPIVEGGVYDCDVQYYNGRINICFALPPIQALLVSMDIEDEDFLEVRGYLLGYTTGQVI